MGNDLPSSFGMALESAAAAGLQRSRHPTSNSRKTAMLNDARSHGLWEMTAPAAPECEALRHQLRADVVVIGGGYTGLSAALHLAEAGKSVAVLEANEIGFGGAGRNVGLINAGMWVLPSDDPRCPWPRSWRASSRSAGKCALPGAFDRRNAPDRLRARNERDPALRCRRRRTWRKSGSVAPRWAARGADVSLLSAEETGKAHWNHGL